MSCCHRLEKLDLGGCRKITDVGLQSLGHLTRVDFLDLSGMHLLTDDGIGSLHALTELRVLNMSHCSPTLPLRKGQPFLLYCVASQFSQFL